MSKLYIAEKHEVAKAIADVLGITRKNDGAYQCGSNLVTWCSGHMLELWEPVDHNPEHKAWNIADLPIFNIPWKYKPVGSKKDQLSKIKSFIKSASEIVHAGDPDPEGQLLIDELFEHFKVTNKRIYRVLINDLNPRLVERSLSTPRPNELFKGLSDAALARSVGDQLYGFNMTRLYTLKARELGAQGVFSVGRVQTPILGLIVARDRLVEGHVKSLFYEIRGTFMFGAILFEALYVPSKHDPLDDNDRLTSKEAAQGIVIRCNNKSAHLSTLLTKDRSENPPLPYDLLALQSDAYRKFRIKPDATLALTQRLREKKLITYNRSDCRYLNEEQHDDALRVLNSIAANAPMLAAAVKQSDVSIKGRCFDSSKVSAHHGIIPAEGTFKAELLSSEERDIYHLIARQYIAQFWPAKISTITTALINVDGHRFKATHTEIQQLGWAVLYKNDPFNEAITKPSADNTESDLTELREGCSGTCTEATLLEKETRPPKHYTFDTLLTDLRRVARYVKNPEIAALLRDKDKDKPEEEGGIGTPATRDQFVPKLVQRKYIVEAKGIIKSTPLGRDFHDALPSYATAPDMTALWHKQQKLIESGQYNVDEFLQNLCASVRDHVSQLRNEALSIKVQTQACPKCADGHLLARRGKHGVFYGCSKYPSCNFSKNGMTQSGKKNVRKSPSKKKARSRKTA